MKIAEGYIQKSKPKQAMDGTSIDFMLAAFKGSGVTISYVLFWKKWKVGTIFWIPELL